MQVLQNEPSQLDGISGPMGDCNCNHCQTDNMIDSIMPPEHESNGTPQAAVYDQLVKTS